MFLFGVDSYFFVSLWVRGYSAVSSDSSYYPVSTVRGGCLTRSAFSASLDCCRSRSVAAGGRRSTESRRRARLPERVRVGLVSRDPASDLGIPDGRRRHDSDTGPLRDDGDDDRDVAEGHVGGQSIYVHM